MNDSKILHFFSYFLLISHYGILTIEERCKILATYKAKKSNFKQLLLKNNTDLDTLALNTNIPKDQLTNYLDTKVMNLNNAMTISKELNCSIEELYSWKVSDK